MPSVHFYIQSKKDPANIYLRLRDGSIDAKAKTNLIIDPEKWSSTKRQPKFLKNTDSKLIFLKMKELESLVFEEFNRTEDLESINTAWLYSLIDPKKCMDNPIPSNLQKYFDFYYSDKESKGAKVSYLKKVKSVHGLISRFDKINKSNSVIGEVNIKWSDKFVLFMKRQNYNQSYIFRTLKFVKTVCIHARDNGIVVSPTLPSISTKDKKAFKVYLSFEEIKLIQSVEMPTESLQNAKDWLIISCFLGQRVSDLMRCHSSLIQETKAGRLIDLTQKKTELPIMIALFPQVEEILKKRNGEFPRPISDQKYNEFIKEVCRISGLKHLEKGRRHDSEINRDVEGMYPKWQLITSHVGRRSFATNYYNSIPISVLMAQTGHKTERSFLEYIGKGRTDQVTTLLEMVYANK